LGCAKRGHESHQFRIFHAAKILDEVGHAPFSSSQRGIYAAIDHRLEQRILSMKPEHETRRKIIREWMSLPKDKRQTEEQAKPFAEKAMERIPSSGDPYGQIMSWLLPRTGRP
jgi:hypothetical protein